MGLYDKIFKPKQMQLSNGKVVLEKATRAPLVILMQVLHGEYLKESRYSSLC